MNSPAPVPESTESLPARILIPRNPSKARLAMFAALLGLWVVVLVVLYLTTVKPLREHPATAPRPQAVAQAFADGWFI